MMKFTIKWWKNNIKPEDYLNHKNKQLKKFNYTNDPATIHLNLSKKLEKGNLLNIPFATKDNLCTKGFETYGGSNILRNYIPPFSATVVEALLDEGGVLKIKTIMDELGMGGTGLISATREVYSPWDKNRIVGGSSSGSALAVAIGLVPFALGSDTGDSIRKPAAFNGIVGFKPSWGLISRWGLMPYAPSLDTIGIFANSTIDVESVLKIIKRKDSKDMTQVSNQNLNFKKDREIKVGFIDNLFQKLDNKEIKDKTLGLINVVKKEFKLNTKKINFEDKYLNLILPIYSVTSFTEALSSNYNLGEIHFGKQEKGENFADTVRNNRDKNFGEVVKKRFALAGVCLEEENQNLIYSKAKKARKIIQNKFDQIFSEVDILITPAANNIAPLVSKIKDKEVGKVSNVVNDFAATANLNGHPSITIPIGYVTENNKKFPFSVEISSNYMTDLSLLDFAKKIEKLVSFKNIIHNEDNND